MEDQHVVAVADRRGLLDQAERVMARAGDVLARMLVGLADVDQHGAGTHEFGRAFGGNGFQLIHGVVSLLFVLARQQFTGSRCL